ncbi:MAG: hypothetical protein QXK74_03600 [Candidatus Nitrosocaldaceae archaeon]
MVSPVALLAITGVIAVGIGVFISLIGSMVNYTITSKEVMEVENDRVREDLNATAVIDAGNNLNSIDVKSNWLKRSVINAIMFEDTNDIYICKLVNEIVVNPLQTQTINSSDIEVGCDLTNMNTKKIVLITELGNAIVSR